MGRPNRFQYQQEGYQKDRTRLFLVVHGRRMGDNRHKLKQERKEKLLSHEDSQAVEQPRVLVLSPSTGFFKSQLD